ncbi:TadE/TadG family type IV pilus assembly protein [Methylopila sp. 73B]|uniref:TadE/TadG family type IV pilus assembly protein n=1 Tax=Methylopila sp. 73B TaxID=1120792 RepID=UPI0003A9DA1F|nr:TadE/TadG family type IV pilus assembly protein [Methylopila sp. 73B]
MHARRLRTWIADFRRDSRGVTAIEFAMVGPVLVLFIVGTIETGLLLTAQQVLDDATFAGARTTKTGYTATNSTQAATITAAIKKAAESYLDPSKIVVTSLAYEDLSKIGVAEDFVDTNKNGKWDTGETFTDTNGNGKWDADRGRAGAGQSGEIVVFKATYSWTVRTPVVARWMNANAPITLTSRTVVKNEPY